MLASARYAEALELLVRAKRSTASGHASGLCAPLTTLHFEGRAGVPKAAKQARRAFEHATQGGHESCADCKGTLARCLRAGDGCEANVAQALVHATSSAAAGSAIGQSVLGTMYANGEGVATRDSEGLGGGSPAVPARGGTKVSQWGSSTSA